MSCIFVSDCEGPISKNDNAFEAAIQFIPFGAEFFSIISKYDDVLADIVKKPKYNAGDTLKLILPFLKAYNVTDAGLREFSAKSMVLIPGSKNTLEYIRNLVPAYVVSTSYEHYIKSLCETVNFPFDNTYCTHLSLDKYAIPEQEKTRLRQIAKDISQKPMIVIPPAAKSLEDFSKQDRETIEWLDDIFWNEISKMAIGEIFDDVKPIGGHEKAIAIIDATRRASCSLSNVLYVGDSITDVEAYKLVREHDGLTVSFNGNEYAVRNAEVAVLSNNNTVTAVIAELFCKLKKEATLQALENWSQKTLCQTPVQREILERFFILFPNRLPKVQIVTTENMDALCYESSKFRRRVRGEAVGRLG